MSNSYKPQPRPLRPGPPLEIGDDVLVYQEIGVALGLWKWKDLAKRKYGENMWEGVERFGKMHGHEANHTLGPYMHQLFAAHMSPGQAFRMAMVAGTMAGQKGHKVAQAALWYHGNGPYNYGQQRPIHFLMPPLIPWTLDCSSFSVQCVIAAGYGDHIPSALKQGNTYSLVDGPFRHVSRNEVHPGDWIFVNTPRAINGHMYVAVNGEWGISHGRPGYPNVEYHSERPIYAIRRVVT